MRRKIIIALSAALMLTSCSNSGAHSKADRNENPHKITPSIIDYGDFTDYGYSYLVDKNTGVVYLKYYGHRSTAITVMLNADGTPVTADQIGLEY